ncbi:hypothetical protein NHX12_029700 [Muraenolepis orangiensis]|uniref:Uncharacterized protein n=1 Tax=Muraenolepis orangiensis TaxID=630683 RepID=A0A9Q0E6Q7_9TELE|nr:hypothetical protein NHX12_029700 [Muraenolepis orangiensis]
MVWQHLEECFGTPEVIENALLKKIEDFPKLTNKDNVKLGELGVILFELECAKAEGYLTGLSYLDTARGVNPYVEKLPFNPTRKIESSWIQVQGGPHSGITPFLCLHFICMTSGEDQKRSMLHSHHLKQSCSFQNGEACKLQQQSLGECAQNRCSNTSDNQAGPAEMKVDDPECQCPIHKKPHPLKKCRSFR